MLILFQVVEQKRLEHSRKSKDELKGEYGACACHPQHRAISDWVKPCVIVHLPRLRKIFTSCLLMTDRTITRKVFIDLLLELTGTTFNDEQLKAEATTMIAAVCVSFHTIQRFVFFSFLSD
jgi:hypothetical protein